MRFVFRIRPYRRLQRFIFAACEIVLIIFKFLFSDFFYFQILIVNMAGKDCNMDAGLRKTLDTSESVKKEDVESDKANGRKTEECQNAKDPHDDEHRKEVPIPLEDMTMSTLKLICDNIDKRVKIKKNGCKMYKCEKCTYASEQKGHLKRHWIAKHTDERFECPLCGKVFTIYDTLARHKAQKHNGIKFSCQSEGCYYQASRLVTVKHHFLVKHTNAKFQCHKCVWEGKTQSLLKKHISKTHDGKMLYCPKCEYKDWDTSNMRRHLEVKHQGVRYKCKLCQNVYTKNSSVSLHMRQKHTKEDMT